jgi:hypothetical protein
LEAVDLMAAVCNALKQHRTAAQDLNMMAALSILPKQQRTAALHRAAISLKSPFLIRCLRAVPRMLWQLAQRFGNSLFRPPFDGGVV